MTNRLQAALVAGACLVCCLPLFLIVVGASTGVAGTVGIWLRRYDLALLALLGLVAVIVVVVRDRRSRRREDVSS